MKKFKGTKEELVKLRDQALKCPTNYEKVRSLTELAIEVPCFRLKGSSELFVGDIYYLSRIYANANPSKKFRIWLIDRGHRVADNPKAF